jgi:hypothetical protein
LRQIVENIVRHALSVRARNVLHTVFFQQDVDYDSYAPTQLRDALLARSQQGPRKLSVETLLRVTRGCGAVVAHEILAWTGLESPADHLCICRQCGREMG